MISCAHRATDRQATKKGLLDTRLGASSHDIARSALGLFNNPWSHERLGPVSPEFA